MSVAAATFNVKTLVRCALFAALIGALGLLPPIPVPVLPVPITAQTLGVMLAGAILGARNGALAVILFLAVVAVGFPLLSGGRGGLGVFFAPSAGFLFGWVLGAGMVGLLANGSTQLPRLIAACLIGGVGAIYLIGVPWMAAVADLTFSQAAIASLAFVPGDVVKAVLAALAARAVHRGYPALRQ
ncbi:MAG: biotin transporter BioY [Rhodospirillaceae bacterium]|nr:biotin transporter BioY [Rhodospirillaceae bacterium]